MGPPAALVCHWQPIFNYYPTGSILVHTSVVTYLWTKHFQGILVLHYSWSHDLNLCIVDGFDIIAFLSLRESRHICFLLICLKGGFLFGEIMRLSPLICLTAAVYTQMDQCKNKYIPIPAYPCFLVLLPSQSLNRNKFWMCWPYKWTWTKFLLLKQADTAALISFLPAH